MKIKFTRLELLAVAAILAGMLLPALNRARSAAQKSNCLANIKQLATGVLLYTGDYDDQLPGVKDNPNWQDNSWMWHLYNNYGFAEKTFVCSNPLNPDKDGNDEHVKGIGDKISDNPIGWGEDNCRTNYSFNQLLLLPKHDWASNFSFPHGKISRVSQTAQAIMICEYSVPMMVDGRNAMSKGISGAMENSYEARDHGGSGFNFALLDGHGESLVYPQNSNQISLYPPVAKERPSDGYFGLFWGPLL